MQGGNILTDLQLQTEITETLKVLPGFVSCISPGHLSCYSDTLLLAAVQYRKLVVKVVQITPSFYVIAYESNQYKWTQIAETVFDIKGKVVKTLKNPKPKTNKLFR